MAYTYPTIEQAYAALFGLVANTTLVGTNVAAFKRAERDIRLWDEIEKQGRAGLPALLQEEADCEYISQPNMPTIIKLEAQLLIIAEPTDAVKVPSTTINTLLDALLSALRPDPSADGMQTLGGLVYDAKPFGRGAIREATRDDSFCYAFLPVLITLYA